MPQLGESIAEATVVALPFQVGDEVENDQEIIEVETNKATMGVTTPCRGRITDLLAELQMSYPVGATLAHVEVSEEDAKRLGLDEASPSPALAETPVTQASPAPEKSRPARVEPTVRGLPVPANASAPATCRPG